MPREVVESSSRAASPGRHDTWRDPCVNVEPGVVEREPRSPHRGPRPPVNGAQPSASLIADTRVSVRTSRRAAFDAGLGACAGGVLSAAHPCQRDRARCGAPSPNVGALRRERAPYASAVAFDDELCRCAVAVARVHSAAHAVFLLSPHHGSRGDVRMRKGRRPRCRASRAHHGCPERVDDLCRRDAGSRRRPERHHDDGARRARARAEDGRRGKSVVRGGRQLRALVPDGLLLPDLQGPIDVRRLVRGRFVPAVLRRERGLQLHVCRRPLQADVCGGEVQEDLHGQRLLLSHLHRRACSVTHPLSRQSFDCCRIKVATSSAEMD